MCVDEAVSPVIPLVTLIEIMRVYLVRKDFKSV